MAKRKDEPSDKGSDKKVLVLISEQALKALLKSDDSYKNKIDGLTGELRETIGNAVEKKHLDKKAFADLKRFHRIKSSEELHARWHTLLVYMDMAGVMKRIESVTQLPIEEGSDNVTQLRAAE